METTAQTPAEANECEKLKKPIQDIVNLTNTIDERYREKCFEVLLNYYLSNNTSGVKSRLSVETQKSNTLGVQDLPAELKMFLEQNNISEETVNNLFLREKGEVRPIYKITEKKKSAAQIQIALLTAFENALATPNAAFEFSLNTVRQRCMENNVYEGNDFFINFVNRAGLFQNLNHETVKLTPIGKTELANALTAVSKTTTV